MGQNCAACLKGVSTSGKNTQDVDLSKFYIPTGLQVIKEDSMESVADTPIRLDQPDPRINLFKGNPNIKLSPKAIETEKLLKPFFSEPIFGSIYILEDDSLYQGQLDSRSQKSGRGIEIFKGNKYIGYFLNNKRHGKGRLIFSAGGFYEGDFKENEFEGVGSLITAEGLEYHGSFNHNKQHGFGKEVWLDGAKFEGMFEEGQKSGHGFFVWSDTSSYKGDFAANKFHGQGTYQWVTGKKYTGDWYDNKMQGFGTFFWPSGRIYEGEYWNDLKHGIGKLTWPDGRVYEGQWKEGKQHGVGVYSYISKKSEEPVKKKGIWNKGVRIEWIKD